MTQDSAWRVAGRVPVERFCREHPYCRNWETPPSGSSARRFAKREARRAVRRGVARDTRREVAA
jgi:hypothetical protein